MTNQLAYSYTFTMICFYNLNKIEYFLSQIDKHINTEIMLKNCLNMPYGATSNYLLLIKNEDLPINCFLFNVKLVPFFLFLFWASFSFISFLFFFSNPCYAVEIVIAVCAVLLLLKWGAPALCHFILKLIPRWPIFI